jgi:segregation and condensation protein B
VSEQQITSPEEDAAEIELQESTSCKLTLDELLPIIEAALFAASEPLSLDRLQGLFFDDEKPEKSTLREILAQLQQQCEGRGVELVEVASGYRYQVRKKFAQWVSRLWHERATRYSRALLETLVLIAYRQPITRAEIEDIRGVAVSTSIMKTLLERSWARVIGHRDVPGRPALYATTREFLDYFNLMSLDDLPPLSELKDFDQINAELDLRMPGEERDSDRDEQAKDADADAEDDDFDEDVTEASDAITDVDDVMPAAAKPESELADESDSIQAEDVDIVMLAADDDNQEQSR